jgi:hypothetical protein
VDLAIHLELFSRCRLSKTSLSLYRPKDTTLTYSRAFVYMAVEMISLYFILIYLLSELLLGCGERVPWYFGR